MGDLSKLESIKLLAPVRFLKVAESQEKIAQMSEEGFRVGVRLAIAQITPYLNLKNEIEVHHANDIKKAFLTRFKHLSLQEVVKAFENERYGVYEKKSEHYQSFSAEYVSEVLMKYEKWKLTKRKQNNLHQKENSIQMTEIDKDIFTIKAVRNQLEFFLQNRIVDDSRIYVYDIFDKAGMMPKDLEYKKGVQKDALDILKKEYENKKALTKKENKNNKKILDQIVNRTNTNKVRLKCKELALEDFLRKEIKQESDIERLINKING